ncbi:tetratricopeptide repeat protein [Candidatus Woesearchaeota archaeon]|nr:tetratricopeptide repeat protein [Candidatus Woesearchaeota archaeon]
MELSKYLEIDIQRFLDEKLSEQPKKEDIREEEYAILAFKKDYEKEVIEAIKNGELEKARKNMKELLDIYNKSPSDSRKKEMAKEILKRIYEKIYDYYKEKEKEESIIDILEKVEKEGIVEKKLSETLRKGLGEKIMIEEVKEEPTKSMAQLVGIEKIEEMAQEALLRIRQGKLEEARKVLEEMNKYIESMTGKERDNALVIAAGINEKIKRGEQEQEIRRIEAEKKRKKRKKLYGEEQEERKLSEKRKGIKEEIKKKIEEKKEGIEIEKELETNNIDKLYWRGLELMKKKEYEEAKKFFEKILRLDPYNLRARIRLGEVMEKIKNG